MKKLLQEVFEQEALETGEDVLKRINKWMDANSVRKEDVVSIQRIQVGVLPCSPLDLPIEKLIWVYTVFYWE